MSAGTIFCEMDLDFSKFEKNQHKLLQSAISVSTSIEKNFQNLGVKSDAIYEAMRRSATNSLEMIVAKSTSSGNEIVRAQKAAADKITAINKEQFGAQTSLIDNLKKNWMAMTAAIGVAMAAVYGVSRSLSSFIDEAAEAEQIENRLRFALENLGYSWKTAKVAVDQFATSIQKTTRFSDEQARQALTDMTIYTNDFAKAQLGAKFAMDMSVRTGQDLHTATMQIGMALTGNVERLGGVIPEFKNLDRVLGENATMAEKSAYAMKVLQEKFGGTAQADLNSYAGQLAQFKNEWGELKEVIGAFLIGPAADFIKWVKEAIQLWREFLGGDLEAKRKRIIDLQLGLLDAALIKEQSLLESGKLRGLSIYLAEERINNILEMRKPLLEELIILEKKKGDIESKKDIFVPEKSEYPEWRKIVGEEREQFEKDYWAALKRTWEIEDNLAKIEAERAQQLADDMFPSMEKVKQIQDKMTEGAEKLRVKLFEMKQLVIDFGWEDYASGMRDASSEATRAVGAMGIAPESVSLEQIQRELEAKIDFYSQISGYEEEYRKKMFEWIDLEAKRFKEAGMEEVAIAKWVAQEKKKISSDIFYKENEDRQQAFSSMAQNFAQMAMLYKEDSTARTTLSTLSKAATIAEIALQAQKNLMIAVGAVVQQGTGDPYTAFARIAAMIAVVSSVLQIVGIAFSSSGGGSRSYSAGGTALGTNTSVLGGATGEASESARRSLELLEDTYTMEYRELTNIYDEMKSLNRNITGLVSSIIRGGQQ